MPYSVLFSEFLLLLGSFEHKVAHHVQRWEVFVFIFVFCFSLVNNMKLNKKRNSGLYLHFTQAKIR